MILPGKLEIIFPGESKIMYQKIMNQEVMAIFSRRFRDYEPGNYGDMYQESMEICTRKLGDHVPENYGDIF